LCVCVSVSGVVVLCRCVRVCDMLIFLHRARTLTPNLNHVMFLCITVDQVGSARPNPRDAEWERLVAAHTPHWLALLYVQVVYFLDLGSRMVYIGTRTLTRNLSCVLFTVDQIGSARLNPRDAEWTHFYLHPPLVSPAICSSCLSS